MNVTELKKMNKKALETKAQELGIDTKGMKVEDMRKALYDATNPRQIYAVNAMRPALIASAIRGNKKAITQAEASACGVSTERYTQWKMWSDRLYDATREWYCAVVDRKPQKDIDAAMNSAYAEWRNILAVGEESQFHKNMWVDCNDLPFFFGFIQDFDSTDETGTFLATKGKTVFRKNVEALLGCRIRLVGVMADDDHDVIIAYKSAKRSLESATKRLKGSDNDKGEHVPGVLDNIKALENYTDGVREELRELGVPEDKIETTKSLVRAAVELKRLAEEKASLNKTISESKKTLDENKEKYGEIISRIPSFE